MSNSTATRPGMKPRPLSPHLQIYRFTPTMAMSIVHRITGVALYGGTLLVAWWLIAAATSQSAFATAAAVMGSWFGLLVLFGFTWALFHHMLGGLRHLVWDTGRGLEKHTATTYSLATLAGSILLTILTWIVILFAGA
ncbi:succinate dehydrogenase, cytochrome b556 subunit [Aquibium sp. ELW1220]|jgi:succinate dehydrogenase / fumarate reductase cytochrome b subunit|uniref:succinate dehydrogenase, cytochrome b556 subunit n=1 Tax=Aquibium sp. ELW1220 TaxID=2976766 RepID=UPI0025B087BB|nr:succinate dehydrogenase, cytochrome b556 subunit [Aquibium sp. ELW1220]MDN2582590.1 succinate dehydrogenase, cytochrome b556 subunit [Aquibium sp. ELW1220]